MTAAQEPSTCTYILKFFTPLLCGHDKFKKAEKSSFSFIRCSPTETAQQSGERKTPDVVKRRQQKEDGGEGSAGSEL